MTFFTDQECQHCGMLVWHDDQLHCGACGRRLHTTADQEKRMTRKHLATYTFDLTVEEGVDEDAANQALDEIELSRQLLNHARTLLAQRGGPLAGIAVIPRHDA